MPEQREAEQAALYRRNESHHRHLDHHHDEPDQSEGDVQPMAADKREESGKKSAALRRCADRDHASEFADLESKEGGAKRESDEGPGIGPETAARINGQGHQSAGVARD